MSLLERESSTEQLNRILKPLGMEIKPKVKKDAAGRVIATPQPKPKKNVKSSKTYKKVTKPFVKPKRQYVTKKPKSTLFGISFNSTGGKIGSKKSKKQSGHNRLY